MSKFELKSLAPDSHIHFIGIGGISMSGLAMIMINNGYRVTGSDRAKSHITDKLESLGAVIFEGHNAENVAGADLIVHTAAVHDDNPEIIASKEANIPLITRAEFLGAIMKLYKNAVGVSGTHGKTTTTGMLAHALIYAEKDPTVSIGGELDIIGGNIKTGSTPYFVTEACEYTNSFLEFFPTIAVITNIEEDHLDFFSGLEEIKESFRQFAYLTKGVGSVVACGSDKNVVDALSGTDLDIKYYGIGKDFDYHAENISYKFGYPSFEVFRDDELLYSLSLKVPGEHNILNSLAVTAVCDLLGCDMEKAKRGIECFSGAHRRFEKKGEYLGATIFDDYAHHPTEIQTTLKSAKEFGANRLWCIFQPHTYTRTKHLWNEFCESFDLVDKLIITDIYAAREKPDGVTNPENLAADIKSRGVDARYLKTFDEIKEVLKEELTEGDLVFTMGAGNVVDIADDITK